MVSAFLDAATVQDLQICFRSSDLFASAQSYFSGSLSSFFCIFTNRVEIKLSVLKLSIFTDKITKSFSFLKMASMTICCGCFCSCGRGEVFQIFSLVSPFVNPPTTAMVIKTFGFSHFLQRILHPLHLCCRCCFLPLRQKSILLLNFTYHVIFQLFLWLCSLFFFKAFELLCCIA